MPRSKQVFNAEAGDKASLESTSESVNRQTPEARGPWAGPSQPNPADLVPFVIEGMTEEMAQSAEADVEAKVTPDFGRSDSVVLDKPLIASTLHWPTKKDVLGVEVSVTDYDEAARLFISAARRGESAVGTFMAVHAVVTAALDPSYRYRINAFDVVGADGQPVRWAMNLLHKAGMVERVCGPIMMLRMCARCADEGVSIYLYGSTPQTLEDLQTALEDKFPGIRIAGVESPPFRSLTAEENQTACDRINASGAGIVFVGLGCPRQDIFAHQNRNRIHAVQLCVGAAFDFHAGNKKMAPDWMQKCGLEWTYRMMQEPRRLWKRYLVTNTAFVLLMTRRVVLGR
jgi:N-acetylglucosaminyldiphosphoundecaprenol N-acetyl-beta-D-mannosaminyltransferase